MCRFYDIRGLETNTATFFLQNAEDRPTFQSLSSNLQQMNDDIEDYSETVD